LATSNEEADTWNPKTVNALASARADAISRTSSGVSRTSPTFHTQSGRRVEFGELELGAIRFRQGQFFRRFR
jgi:hypothetical protein